MKALIFSEPTYIFMTPDEMYGELGKLKSCHKYAKNANIYFITKMKKVKFDTRYKKVDLNGNITLKIIRGDKVEKVKFDPIDYIYNINRSYFQEIFKSKNNFFIYLMHNQYLSQKSHIRLLINILKKTFSKNIISKKIYFKLMKIIYAKEVNIIFSSAYTVNIDEPILKASTLIDTEDHHEVVPFDNQYDEDCYSNVNMDNLKFRETGTITLTIDQIINLNNIDVGDQEVLYIGQTKREPFERLLPHEKLQKLIATHTRNEHEAIVVHLFNFKQLGKYSDDNKLEKSDKITTLEAELIHYFKPTENNHYKDSSRSTWNHIKKLKSLKYSDIAIELNIDGEYCKFRTNTINLDNKNIHAMQVKI